MANAITGYLQTLVSAGQEAAQVMVGTTAWLDSVYKDFRSNTAAKYDTINVVLPGSQQANVTDIGAGSGALTDLADPFVAITLNHHYQNAFVVRDFEQATAGANILQNNMFAMLAGLGEAINAAGCALLTTGNFNVNTNVTTAAGTISKGDLLSGITQLKKAKVPLTSSKVTLLTNSDVHSNILSDDELTSARIASNQVAYDVHAGGDLQTIYGAKLKFDQGLDGLTTGSAGTFVYKAALFHEWSMAIVSAVPTAPIGQSVEYTYTSWKGIPIRITMGYERALLGNVVQVDAIFGVKVVRPALGVVYTVDEAGSEDALSRPATKPVVGPVAPVEKK